MNEQHPANTTWTKQEALVVVQDLRAQQRIDQLYAKADSIDDTEVAALIEQVHAPSVRIEQKLLSTLIEHDPEVDALLQNTADFSKSLRISQQIVQETGDVPDALIEQVTPLLDTLNAQQHELWQTVLHGQFLEDVSGALGALADSVSSVDSQWTVVLRKGNLPSFLIEHELENGETVSFLESVSFWIDLQQLVSDLEEATARQPDKKKRRLLRAKVFREALKDKTQFLSPAILEDLIEERFDKTDPWIANNIFETFAALDEEIQQHEERAERKLTPTQKRLIAVMVGVILGVTITAAGGEQLQSRIHSLAFPEPPAPAQVENRQAPVETPPQRERSSSPENSGDFPQGLIWSIEGEIPDGYLRTDVAETFYANPQWNMTSSYGQESYYPTTSNEAVTYYVSEFTITEPGYYPIPLPYTGLRVVSVDLGSGDYTVSTNEEGLSTLNVRTISSPGTVRIGLGHSNAEVTDSPNQYDLDTSILLGDMTGVPAETQQLIRNVLNLPIQERAERITAYVKNYFTYSLDPRYSDYQRENGRSGEFVRRIFEMPFGDCDVINTVNVALLRAAGVPARMAYGYMNESSLVSTGGNSIDRGEGHGWAEYFNGSEWVRADATPTRVDDYTRERLEKRQQQSQGEGGQSVDGQGGEQGNQQGGEGQDGNQNGGNKDNPTPSSEGQGVDLNDLGVALKLFGLQAIDWWNHYGAGSAVLTLMATYFGSLIALNRSRKNQNDRIQKVSIDIQKTRPKTGAGDVERHLLSTVTNEQIDVQNLSERNPNFAMFLLDYITVLPVAIVNRVRHSRISKAEQGLAATSPEQMIKRSIYDVLHDSLGMTAEAAGNRIIEYNKGYHLHHSISPFFDGMMNRMGERTGLDAFIMPEGFETGNDGEAMVRVARKSATLEDFLNSSVQIYYVAYEKEYKRLASKKRAPNEKFPVKVSLEHFSESFAGDFAYLVDFYKQIEAQDRAKAKVKAESAKQPKKDEDNTEL